MYTVLRFARSSHEAALSVNLRARLTEIGTLELECVARATGNEEDDRWKLQFDLRAHRAEHRGRGGGQSVAPAAASPATIDPQKLEAARSAVLRALYGKDGRRRPADA